GEVPAEPDESAVAGHGGKRQNRQRRGGWNHGRPASAKPHYADHTRSDSEQDRSRSQYPGSAYGQAADRHRSSRRAVERADEGLGGGEPIGRDLGQGGG